jgi:hypothetical protein
LLPPFSPQSGIANAYGIGAHTTMVTLPENWTPVMARR